MLDFTIYALRGFEVILTVFSVSIHSFCIWKLWKATIFHPMLRRCLLIFEVSSIIFSIAHSSQGIVAAVLGIPERISTRLNADSFLEQINFGLLFVSSVAAYTLWLAQTFCILERAISTRYLESYQFRFLGIKSFIVFICVFVSFDILQISLNILNGYLMIGLTALHSAANFVMSVLLQCVNKREDKIERKLDVRYQVKKNLKILPIFIRIGAVCVGRQIINTTLFVVTVILHQSEASDILGHAYFICTELYALTATVILLSSSLMNCSQMFKLKRKERKIEPEISEGQLYLQMLKRQWN